MRRENDEFNFEETLKVFNKTKLLKSGSENYKETKRIFLTST